MSFRRLASLSVPCLVLAGLVACSGDDTAAAPGDSGAPSPDGTAEGGGGSDAGLDSTVAPTPDAGDGGQGDDAQDSALPQGVGLDTTFGEGGLFASMPEGGASGYFGGVVLQAGGGIVASGSFLGNNGFVPFVARVLPTGAGKDPTFGGDGGGGTFLFPSAQAHHTGSDLALVAQQADGRLVVATFCESATSGRTWADLCVYRLSADGAFDTSYGQGGTTHIATSPGDLDTLQSLWIDAQGRALVLGYANADYDGGNETVSTQTFIARLGTNGQLDPAFNGGVVEILPSLSAFPYAGATLSTGRILVVATFGSGGERAGIQAFNADGSPDTTFAPATDGGSGSNQLSLPLGQTTSVSLVVAADDTAYLLANESSDTELEMLRLTSAGAIDTAFGDHGVASLSSGTASTRATLLGSVIYTASQTMQTIHQGDGSGTLQKIATTGARLPYGTQGKITVPPIVTLYGVAASAGGVVFVGQGQSPTPIVGKAFP